MKSDFMNNIYQENLELFQYVSTHVGENITDIVRLDYVYDTLFIESISGYELPKWTEKVYPGTCDRELLRKISLFFEEITILVIFFCKMVTISREKKTLKEKITTGNNH